MKKLLLITAISFFGITKMQAQNVEFGVKIGANFSSLYGDVSNDVETITSVINYGIYSEIHFTEKFSFQPEVMYSMQGFSLGDDITSLNYLNVPLMGKYYLTKGLNIEAGPQIGFLLSAKEEGEDIKNSFKTLDLGFNLGLGYKLNNGFNFGLRYNLGLSNINDLENTSNKIRNGVAQFTLGYSF